MDRYLPASIFDRLGQRQRAVDLHAIRTSPCHTGRQNTVTHGRLVYARIDDTRVFQPRQSIVSATSLATDPALPCRDSQRIQGIGWRLPDGHAGNRPQSGRYSTNFACRSGKSAANASAVASTISRSYASGQPEAPSIFLQYGVLVDISQRTRFLRPTISTHCTVPRSCI